MNVFAFKKSKSKAVVAESTQVLRLEHLTNTLERQIEVNLSNR